MDEEIKKIEQILPNEKETKFQIINYTLNLMIDSKLNNTSFIENYKIKRVREGEGFWFLTSKANKDNFKLYSVRSNGNLLKCDQLLRDDNKVSYKIILEECTKVNDELEFTIEYDENISEFTNLNNNSKLSLTTDYMYNFHITFANICENLELNFISEDEVITLANNGTDFNKKFKYTEKSIAPFDTKVINLKIKKKKVSKEKIKKALLSLFLVLIGAFFKVIFENIFGETK